MVLGERVWTKRPNKNTDRDKERNPLSATNIMIDTSIVSPSSDHWKQKQIIMYWGCPLGGMSFLVSIATNNSGCYRYQFRKYMAHLSSYPTFCSPDGAVPCC